MMRGAFLDASFQHLCVRSLRHWSRVGAPATRVELRAYALPCPPSTRYPARYVMCCATAGASELDAHIPCVWPLLPDAIRSSERLAVSQQAVLSRKRPIHNTLTLPAITTSTRCPLCCKRATLSPSTLIEMPAATGIVHWCVTLGRCAGLEVIQTTPWGSMCILTC